MRGHDCSGLARSEAQKKCCTHDAGYRPEDGQDAHPEGLERRKLANVALLKLLVRQRAVTSDVNDDCGCAQELALVRLPLAREDAEHAALDALEPSEAVS